MERLIDAERGNKAIDFKGLAQRFRQYAREREPGVGYANSTHVDEINKAQDVLITLIKDYIDSGCGDPPDKILDYATKPLPKLTPKPVQSPHPFQDLYWKYYPFTGPFWDSVRDWQNAVERNIMRGLRPNPGQQPGPIWPWPGGPISVWNW